MLPTFFDNTTIPVLQEVASFTQARHNVFAGNIANSDTPGYRDGIFRWRRFKPPAGSIETRRGTA